jgi:hypothetical protein
MNSLINVNTKTKLIDYASYTLKDNYLPAPKGLYGTIYFKDFREIEGVKIPFQQTVFTKDPKTKGSHIQCIKPFKPPLSQVMN